MCRTRKRRKCSGTVKQIPVYSVELEIKLNDKKVYISSFNANYGWGAVMENVFSALKSCLEDGSRLAYAQDNDEVELVVKDRNIEKTYKEYEEENEDEIANNEPVKD